MRELTEPYKGIAWRHISNSSFYLSKAQQEALIKLLKRVPKVRHNLVIDIAIIMNKRNIAGGARYPQI